MPFQRPTLPYNNVSLPNSNRYTALSNSGTPRPPTAEMVDADINYLVDTANILEEQINDVEAGAIPGSNNPNNANRLLTTDGDPDDPTLSWIKVGQNQYEDGSIPTVALANQAVTSDKIQLGSIVNNLIAPNAIGTDNIINENITSAKLAASSVINSKIAPLAITESQLAENIIGPTRLAPLAVTTPKLADNCVTTAKISDESISTGKLVESAVTTTKLAPASVVPSKIGTQAIFLEKIAGAFCMATVNLGVVNIIYNINVVHINRIDFGIYTVTMAGGPSDYFLLSCAAFAGEAPIICTWERSVTPFVSTLNFFYPFDEENPRIDPTQFQFSMLYIQ